MVALLIHVGYHKTATTWMQRQLFRPEHGYRQLCGHTDVFDLVVRPHGLRFEPDSMRALIDRALNTVEQGESAVISSEILSGHPFQGGHESDVFAARLQRIAPHARILISIRSQLRILPSVYMQYVLRGGTMTATQFFDGTNEPGYFGFSPEHFEYDRLVSHYQDLFGSDKVHVITQESLKDDRDSTLTLLAAFAGNEHYNGLIPSAQKVVGESYPEYSAPILRRINHVQKSTINPNPVLSLGVTPRGLYKIAGFVMKRPPVSTILKSHKPITAYVRDRFTDYYRESNRRLASLIPHKIDLSAYEM